MCIVLIQQVEDNVYGKNYEILEHHSQDSGVLLEILT